MRRGQPVRDAYRLAGGATFTRSQPAARKQRHRAQPVTVTRVPAAVLAVARELAGGDGRRVRVQRDGSVVVTNRPRAGAR